MAGKNGSAGKGILCNQSSEDSMEKLPAVSVGQLELFPGKYLLLFFL